jgi:hypothetical protein
VYSATDTIDIPDYFWSISKRNGTFWRVFCTGNHSGYDAFSTMLTIPDIVVTLSLPKPAITPTYTNFGRLLKSCDIILSIDV